MWKECVSYKANVVDIYDLIPCGLQLPALVFLSANIRLIFLKENCVKFYYTSVKGERNYWYR